MQHELTIRKVPAESVLFGPEICTRGHSVWVVYVGSRVIAVTATKVEAKRKVLQYEADLRTEAGRRKWGTGGG